MSIGAKFLKADLHIHSFGQDGSFDVTDVTMTPSAIVDLAIEKGLKIISVTDHNEIGNSITAVRYAADKDILVIPGIEVSTTQGHLLAYFPDEKALRDFFGKLTVKPDKTLTHQGILECMESAQSFGGICVLAHIELTSGFETAIGRFNPQMEEILCHKNLYGLEISNRSSELWYTNDEQDLEDGIPQSRKRLMGLRRTKLELDGDYHLAKLMSSDAHTLAKLGTNAEGERKLTRIKVDELNFHSFCIALLTPESRIRLEETIPDSRPIIKSLKLSGGILDTIDVELSPNLTCIIGSRGAGKSTLLEALKEGTGNKSDSKVVDSEVWPSTILVEYEDETGQTISFRRDKFDTTRNLTDSQNGIKSVEIEKYGQGETALTVQQSDTNPQSLINFLDEFVDFGDLKAQDKIVVQELLDNQTASKKIRLELSSLDDTKRALQNNKTKLEMLEKANAGGLVKLQSMLITERTIRIRLLDEVTEAVAIFKRVFDGTTLANNIATLNKEQIVAGKDFFPKVESIITELGAIAKAKGEELNTALNLKVVELQEALKSWSTTEQTLLAQIDAKKIELETAGIAFDLGKIQQLASEKTLLDGKLAKLHQDGINLAVLEKERKALLSKREFTRKEIYKKRYVFAQQINLNLKSSLDGLFIKVEFRYGCYSKHFEELLKSVMEWRTIQVPKSQVIASQMTPLDFVTNCKTNNRLAFAAVKDTNGNQLLSDGEITNVISRCSKENAFEEFETLIFEDLPSISVTKKTDEGHITRQISQLSLGQQQSIILAILLLSKSDKPLIIDQPEDNLDSEFIFKTIVKNLRKIKERRQVIIVTHNANIAVLGDAELVIPLKSTNDKSFVLEPGSIDKQATRLLACDILEGGKNAFKQRQKIYGIS